MLYPADHFVHNKRTYFLAVFPHRIILSSIRNYSQIYNVSSVRKFRPFCMCLQMGATRGIGIIHCHNNQQEESLNRK